MSLLVRRPGLLTTVQDLGRPGWRRFAIPEGGAVDAVALRVANLLVGNPPDAAALECTLWGPVLEFDRPCLVALCGGDLSPRIDGVTLPAARPVWIERGATLELGSAARGARAVLAVAGGIDVPQVLGGRGTLLVAGIGGFSGRALRAGDRPPLGGLAESSPPQWLAAARDPAHPLWSAPRWSARGVLSRGAVAGETTVVRVLRGAHLDQLVPAARELVLGGAEFTVGAQSDRMGARLAGPSLERARHDELISDGVCAGTVQLPPDGQPIVLLADCATTGGYARIAQVISADLPHVAQAPPGARLRFHEVTLDEARQLSLEQESRLRRLECGLRLRREER